MNGCALVMLAKVNVKSALRHFKCVLDYFGF